MMGVKLFLKPSFIMHLQLATILSFQFAQLAFNSKNFYFCMVFATENRYFLEKLFSGKENVFMCLVAFQKMFRKIFSDVWLCS